MDPFGKPPKSSIFDETTRNELLEAEKIAHKRAQADADVLEARFGLPNSRGAELKLDGLFAVAPDNGLTAEEALAPTPTPQKPARTSIDITTNDPRNSVIQPNNGNLDPSFDLGSFDNNSKGQIDASNPALLGFDGNSETMQILGGAQISPQPQGFDIAQAEGDKPNEPITLPEPLPLPDFSDDLPPIGEELSNQHFNEELKRRDDEAQESIRKQFDDLFRDMDAETFKREIARMPTDDRVKFLDIMFQPGLTKAHPELIDMKWLLVTESWPLNEADKAIQKDFFERFCPGANSPEECERQLRRPQPIGPNVG